VSVSPIVVADHRAMPVSVIRHEDIDRMDAAFERRRLPIMRSVYFAVVRLVAESPGGYAEATRKELAAAASVSVRTLDEAMKDLVGIDVVHVVKRREDGINLPNLYALGPDGGGGAADDTTPVACTSAGDDTQQSSSGSPSAGRDEGSASSAAPPVSPLVEALAGVEVPADLIADGEALLARKVRVDGRVATADEIARAVASIAEFNRQASSDFGVGAHLPSIVMRVRERPSYTTEAFVRLVQSAWRIRWWERRGSKRRATPAVIFGNAGCFENVVQDAIEEKKGQAPQGSRPAQPGRFQRTKTAEEDL